MINKVGGICFCVLCGGACINIMDCSKIVQGTFNTTTPINMQKADTTNRVT